MLRHAQLDFDRQVCFPLYATSRALTRAYTPLLEPVGLTYPQYLTMLALWSSPDGSTVGELGRRLHLDSGTLTPLLKRLETAGLVERHRDPADERRVIVTVTPYGDRLQEQVAHVPEALATQLGLTLDEGIMLHTLLHRVLQTLDDGALGTAAADRASTDGALGTAAADRASTDGAPATAAADRASTDSAPATATADRASTDGAPDGGTATR